MAINDFVHRTKSIYLSEYRIFNGVLIKDIICFDNLNQDDFIVIEFPDI